MPKPPMPPTRVLHIGLVPALQAIGAGVVITPPMLRFYDIVKNVYDRGLAFDKMVTPIKKEAPVSLSTPMSKQLQRIRSLFSEPNRVADFHKIIQHIDKSCEGKSPEEWIGTNHCAKISVVAAVALRSQGFDATIHGIVGGRTECVGIDHAWVEVPVSAGFGETSVVVDLSCRQYTGKFRNHAIEVPHGAIAPKAQFLTWVGTSAENWEGAVNLSNSDIFKPAIKSFEAALYDARRLNEVTIYTPLVGKEDFAYGARLFLLTQEFLRKRVLGA